jgi:hypothetical protein
MHVCGMTSETLLTKSKDRNKNDMLNIGKVVHALFMGSSFPWRSFSFLFICPQPFNSSHILMFTIHTVAECRLVLMKRKMEIGKYRSRWKTVCVTNYKLPLPRFLLHCSVLYSHRTSLILIYEIYHCDFKRFLLRIWMCWLYYKHNSFSTVYTSSVK